MQASLRNVMLTFIPRLRFTRTLAWNAFLRPSTAHRTPPPPTEEDAKAAILEKVMKSRFPSDLMLRCMSPALFCTFTHRRSFATRL